MRWQGRAESSNVEDRRMGGGAKVAVGGGLGAVVIAVIAMLFGVDPRQLTGGAGITPSAGGGAYTPSPQEEELAKFTKVVLKDTEDVWNEIFNRAGRRYEEPKLVLFSGTVQSACGGAEAAMGPFYCPGDHKVYIDLSFYTELKNKLGAPGDFAFAYVIAHEVGHHVQNLLGYSDRVHQARNRVSKQEYNQLSVRLELQADFLAGVFAHHAHRTKNILEAGDVEEAMRAAAAVGDDKLQKSARGYAVPDSFTHGTSEQRARWFRKGLETGDLRQGDTFNIPYESL
jgi:predicted metalloprotease